MPSEDPETRQGLRSLTITQRYLSACLLTKEHKCAQIAAETMGTSRFAIAMMIRRVEHKIGGKLFLRSRGRGLGQWSPTNHKAWQKLEHWPFMNRART